MSPTRLPERTRTYQNHHFDSTRWDNFVSRPDDIVIATSYKAGTTWTQGIVAHLLFHGRDLPGTISEVSPWLDSRTQPLELILKRLEDQQHRRFIKTHLPLDGLPYDPNVKYLYVTRDARDVFMSLWNHYSNHTEEAFRRFNETPGRVGDELPRPPENLHLFWQEWITRGWFEWENDGWPYWSHLYNVQSWWDYRHLPNIQLFHYADMLEDTEREVRRIGAFLEIELPDVAWVEVAEAVSFAAMKKAPETYVPGAGALWKGGGDTFLNKGVNGRWREVLSEKELSLYDAACDRTLSDECRKWLEQGGAV
jgi:aryl sulfotransferase